MSRLQQTFQELQAIGRAALVPFITAGDPDTASTLDFMQKLVAAGADIIELGIPFSDPMADGPVIQAASERALANGTSLRDVLEIVSQFRLQNTHTPIVLMGYANPLEVMGYDKFADHAVAAGVDAIIIVDLPPEEASDVLPILKAKHIDPIFLLAPTTSQQRMRGICESASGFVYYVSLKGVTGAATLDVESVKEKLAQIRQHTKLPVGVGFGVKDADSARQLAAVADAVVVGSAIVNLVARYNDAPNRAGDAIAALVSEMRSAIDEDLTLGVESN